MLVGQQPSPLVQVVIGVATHAASQVAALPVSRFGVQALPEAGQLVGQLPSHFSPGSTVPLPHRQAGV
jgi:hypothetical protein